MDRCLVRYLGPPPGQTRCPGSSSPTAPAAATEEVVASSLVKFPGGQSLVATGWQTLAPPAPEELAHDVKAAKAAREKMIRREFLLPANEGRKVKKSFRLCEWTR